MPRSFLDAQGQEMLVGQVSAEQAREENAPHLTGL